MSYSGPDSKLDLLELGSERDSGAVRELAELLGVNGWLLANNGLGMS